MGMTYHGNCCICVLTLGLCVFGSITTSAGVSLLLNYQLFGGNSSWTASPRTLPPGHWNFVVGVIMTGAGSLVFVLGMFIAICCLTVGIPDKTDKSKYELFENEEGALFPESSEKIYGVTTAPQDISPEKPSSACTAYDEAFTPQDTLETCAPVRDSPEADNGTGSVINALPDSLKDKMWAERNRGGDESVQIVYPSVILRDPIIEDSSTVDDSGGSGHDALSL